MTTIIEQARAVWEEKRERLTKEDWMLLADALIEGKAWCAEHKGHGGPKGFGKWCLENGFGSVPNIDRSDAMHIAREHREGYLSYHNDKVTHPRAFLAGIRKQREIELGQHFNADLAAWVAKHPEATSEEIADGLGVDKETVRKRTSSLTGRGVLSKTKDEDGAVRFTLGDGEPKPKVRSVEDRIAMEAARKELPIPTYLLREIVENMCWLNTMTARELNDGTIMMPQVDLDTQASRFKDWAKSIRFVSGRTEANVEPTSNGGLRVWVKPYNSAPISIQLMVEVEDV